MQWYVKKGDDLARDQNIKFEFHRRSFDGFEDVDLIFRETLYIDESKRAHKYPEEPFVRKNCTLTADLRAIDRSSLVRKKRGANGKYYFLVRYHLVVSLKSAAMKFSLEIDGKEYGIVAATYEGEG